MFYCVECKANIDQEMRYWNNLKSMHLCSKHYHWHLAQGNDKVTDGFILYDDRGKDDSDDDFKDGCCGPYSCN